MVVFLILDKYIYIWYYILVNDLLTQNTVHYEKKLRSTTVVTSSLKS